MGVLAGIITGLVGGAAYNRWSEIQTAGLPELLRRQTLCAIATGFFCLVLAAIFGYVWPPVQHAIHAGGEWIVSAGALGSGIFGFYQPSADPNRSASGAEHHRLVPDW